MRRSAQFAEIRRIRRYLHTTCTYVSSAAGVRTAIDPTYAVPRAHAALAVCGGYDPARLGNPSEQIGVRSRADEVKVLAIDLVDQQPVRFDVAVAKVPPLAAKRMVFVAGRQRISLDQQLGSPHATSPCPCRASGRVSRRAGTARR